MLTRAFKSRHGQVGLSYGEPLWFLLTANDSACLMASASSDCLLNTSTSLFTAIILGEPSARRNGPSTVARFVYHYNTPHSLLV